MLIPTRYFELKAIVEHPQTAKAVVVALLPIKAAQYEIILHVNI